MLELVNKEEKEGRKKEVEEKGKGKKGEIRVTQTAWPTLNLCQPNIFSIESKQNFENIAWKVYADLLKYPSVKRPDHNCWKPKKRI